MALQTATTVAPTTNSNTLPTATSSANSTDTTTPTNPVDLGKNSIPFSFLVAFLALFVAFMGIGLFARRFVHFVRLRLGLAVPEPRERRGGRRVRKERPVIWDVCIHPAQDTFTGGGTSITEDANDDKWRDINPLACYFLRDQDDLQPTDTHNTPSHYTHPTLLPHAFVGTGRMSIAPLPPPRSFFHPPDTSSPSTPMTTRRTHTYDSQRRITSPHPLQDIMLNIREFLHPHPHPHPHTDPHSHTHTPRHTDNMKQKNRSGEDELRKDKDERHAESVRIATLIAMPSEERGWRSKFKAGRDRTSVGSSSTMDEEEGVGVGGGIEQYVGGELSIGVADFLLDWRDVDRWEEDVEDDEKT